MFSLNPQASTPLVLQVVEGFRQLVEDGTLRAGAKLPSIRQFAHAHGVSVYTVVDAYDRLVAQGYFVSRPHSGFFVRRRADTALEAPGPSGQYSFDSMWYMQRIFENRALRLKPGCGWLPGEWLFSEGVRVNVVRSRLVRTESFDATFGADFHQFLESLGGFEDCYTTPEDVANVILALGSGLLDAVGGQVIMADKGFEFFDNLMGIAERAKSRGRVFWNKEK